MASPFVGEIRMFGGNFAPAGWLFCAGQLLPISDNPTLFQLIGTTYGGDGQTNFALPDLRGRVPVHVGPGFALAQSAGTETVTLTTTQIPAHNHVPQGATGGPVTSPANAYPGSAVGGTGNNIYGTATPNTNLVGATIQNTGGNQPHNNFQPYLCISFIISLFGIFPTQN